ncbi:MAG TPA: homoserine kinase, partial [Nitrosarchaeum sp.]|nr:homoserine kinase [Nitrosarchaeum sp.]
MANSITVKAPSSTANLGPGFDVFGLALDAFFDQIKISKKKQKGISIISENNIPTNPAKNTAGLVVKAMQKKFKINDGLEIKIKKGVPAGFGIGSSAASAAAAAVAFDSLYKLNLDKNSLVRFAGEGEKASAGSIHYDNVAASVLGGFVIVRTNPFDTIKIRAPTNLVLCLAIPKLAVPAKKTKVSRSVIPRKIKFSDSIKNLSSAAAIVAGFVKNDPDI